MDAIETHVCTTGDSSLFDRIALEVFDWPLDREKLEAYLALSNHHLIVAISDGEIVGQLTAITYQHPEARPGELYIDELGVTPNMQRRGIATRLVARARALAEEFGCSDVWLAMEPDNEGARAFYASLSGEFEEALLFVSSM